MFARFGAQFTVKSKTISPFPLPPLRLRVNDSFALRSTLNQKTFLARECRIAVVLSFRSPIKARGSNYMYGADGSTVEIDLSVYRERADSTDRRI